MEGENVIETAVGAKILVRFTEHQERKKQVLAGRLLELDVTVRELVGDLPPWVVPDPEGVARGGRERVTAARGFFLGVKGNICSNDGGADAKGFLTSGLIGPSEGGRKLAPGEAFEELAAAVEAERFTLGDVEVFASDKTVLGILRQGAMDHLTNFFDRLVAAQGQQAETAALDAIAKAKIVPGFNSGAGREALLDYAGVLVKKARAGDLLTLAAKIEVTS